MNKWLFQPRFRWFRTAPSTNSVTDHGMHIPSQKTWDGDLVRTTTRTQIAVPKKAMINRVGHPANGSMRCPSFGEMPTLRDMASLALRRENDIHAVKQKFERTRITMNKRHWWQRQPLQCGVVCPYDNCGIRQ
jgi:hypothetical protein